MLSGVCVFVIWWYPMVSEGIHSITFLSTEGYYSSIFYIFQCFTWNIFNFIFFDPGNVSRETLPGTDCQKIIFASLLENLNFFESSDFFLLYVKDTPPGFLSPYLPSRNFCCIRALWHTHPVNVSRETLTGSQPTSISTSATVRPGCSARSMP